MSLKPRVEYENCLERKRRSGSLSFGTLQVGLGKVLTWFGVGQVDLSVGGNIPKCSYL
jgi:hypothetical protein